MAPHRRDVLERTGLTIAGLTLASRTAVDAARATTARTTSGQEFDQTTTDRPLRITSASLPERVVPDEPYGVSVTVENTGDDPMEPTPSYAFDGQRVLSGAPPDSLPIPAGETQQFRFGGITLEMVDQSLPEPLTAGDHTHSVGLVDGPRESGTVRVEGTPSGGGSDTVDSSRADSERRRGFFTNQGPAPGLLTDSFALTVGGFVLSAVGIVYQLVQGR